MAVQKETKGNTIAGDTVTRWVEGKDENGEVIFVRSTLFDPALDTVEEGRAVPRVEMIRRFGQAGIKQKISL